MPGNDNQQLTVEQLRIAKEQRAAEQQHITEERRITDQQHHNNTSGGSGGMNTTTRETTNNTTIIPDTPVTTVTTVTPEFLTDMKTILETLLKRTDEQEKINQELRDLATVDRIRDRRAGMFRRPAALAIPTSLDFITPARAPRGQGLPPPPPTPRGEQGATAQAETTQSTVTAITTTDPEIPRAVRNPENVVTRRATTNTQQNNATVERDQDFDDEEDDLTWSERSEFEEEQHAGFVAQKAELAEMRRSIERAAADMRDVRSELHRAVSKAPELYRVRAEIREQHKEYVAIRADLMQITSEMRTIKSEMYKASCQAPDLDRVLEESQNTPFTAQMTRPKEISIDDTTIYTTNIKDNPFTIPTIATSDFFTQMKKLDLLTAKIQDMGMRLIQLEEVQIQHTKDIRSNERNIDSLKHTVDSIWDSFEQEIKSTNADVTQLTTCLNVTIIKVLQAEKALVRMTDCQNLATQYPSSKARVRSFYKGDLVLREAFQNIAERNVDKLDTHWEEPYQITKVVRPGVYEIASMKGEMTPRSWNTKHLKKYYF